MLDAGIHDCSQAGSFTRSVHIAVVEGKSSLEFANIPEFNGSNGGGSSSSSKSV